MDPDNGVPSSTPVYTFVLETPCSMYKPPESLVKSDNEATPLDTSKEKLNEFLSSRDISPIRPNLNTALHFTKERTKCHYVREAHQAIHAVIDEIAPKDTDSLWEALMTSRGMARQFPENIKDHADTTLIEALSKCHNNAEHWATRWQFFLF